jgi:peptidase E
MSLNVPENFSVIQSPFYWVKINNTMSSIDSERQFLKLFTKNVEEIKQFINKSDINIKK